MSGRKKYIADAQLEKTMPQLPPFGALFYFFFAQILMLKINCAYFGNGK